MTSSTLVTRKVMTAGVPLREGAIVTTGTDGTPVPDNAALSTDERAELQRLRAEVAELRSQAAAEPAVSDQTVVTAPPARVRWQRWRSVVATLLPLHPTLPGGPVGSQHVDAEPVMLGERGRLRMQRHRQLRCDVAFDDGFGGVVDDRARHPTEMREGPPVTVPESGQISMSVRSHASINGMNGVISLGCVPARGGFGADGASSAKYFRTVRQSQPHSRPISANVAPAACKARKRRMFIQDSKSRIMSRSPFGSSTCRWTTEG